MLEIYANYNKYLSVLKNKIFRPCHLTGPENITLFLKEDRFT